MDLAGTNGLIIGAQTSVGVELARHAEAAGAAHIVLCDTVERPWPEPQRPTPAPGVTVLARTRLGGGDAIELARLFAGTRHDHGPLDWVCSVTGPDADLVRPALPPRPDAAPAGPRLDLTDRAGPAGSAGHAVATTVRARRELAEVVTITPPIPVRPWPELSLARIVSRTQDSFVRSAVVTRLAVEEFRHRGGALLHIWAASADDSSAEDALWEANRAALDALARAGVTDGSGATDPNIRIGMVDARHGGAEAAAAALGALTGRARPASVLPLIRDNH